MNTVKKSTSKMKVNGVTYLHYSKCDSANSHSKDYVVNSAGVQYFKMKDKVVVNDEDVLVDEVFELPNVDNIESIDYDNLDTPVQEEVKTPKAKVTVTVEEKTEVVGRMKQRFLNKITGAYVGYGRMIQLKCQKRWID